MSYERAPSGSVNEYYFEVTYPDGSVPAWMYLYSSHQQRRNPLNVVKPFSGLVWSLIGLVVVSFCCAFLVFKHFYGKLDRPDLNLVNMNLRTSDVMIKTICTVTEPESITFFPVMSTGMTVLFFRI